MWHQNNRLIIYYGIGLLIQIWCTLLCYPNQYPSHTSDAPLRKIFIFNLNLDPHLVQPRVKVKRKKNIHIYTQKTYHRPPIFM